jgi:hypothetical protein
VEFWEFSWDGENWVLDKIHQNDSMEIVKIAWGEEE